MTRKPKKPGDMVPWKLRDDEPDRIIIWLNSQKVISKSIRHLIEKDIAENGIRDVGEEIKSAIPYQSFVNENKIRQLNTNKPEIIQFSSNQEVVATEEEKTEGVEILETKESMETNVDREIQQQEEKHEAPAFKIKTNIFGI